MTSMRRQGDAASHRTSVWQMIGLKAFRYTAFCAAAFAMSLNSGVSADDLPQIAYEIFPDQPRQTVLGIGVEIQSDSIGSGNNGIPDAPIAVPHDLTPSERDRFAKEMLKGFRYLRLAGGLYWRGLDSQEKYLQPRWPSQLSELNELMEKADIEGLSFEYWSPAPYWKANLTYIGDTRNDPKNTLRPFVSGFDKDPDYQGDREKFFRDFSNAVVQDIKTLEKAGMQVSMFGLQNEPGISNSIYPSHAYYSAADYLEAFQPVAAEVRAHNPDIMIIADSDHHGYPTLIGEGMDNPAIAELVDAYVVHTIGWDSSTVADVHARIINELPPRPWFQNEYEYLTGVATPQRALNTVQHIMDSFQIAENPSWFWLHALKPSGNAEASGYALGFWNSRIAPNNAGTSTGLHRWRGGPVFSALPPELAQLEYVFARRGDTGKAGLSYDIILDQPATLYLLVEDKGDYILQGWEATNLTAAWDGGSDTIYSKTVPAGRVVFPAHDGNVDGRFGAPHAVFIAPATETAPDVMIGINKPIYVHSKLRELEKLTEGLAPGHWTFNPFNWNPVGSFIRKMPWDSRVLGADAATDDKDARLLVFEKPNGKRTIVVSNRHSETATFTIQTNLDGATWRGSRYTPWEAGDGTEGVVIGETSGAALTLQVPSLSWEFWEEQ